MSLKNPFEKSKEEHSKIIEKIHSESAVGIDAQLTHAIIIDYLQELTKRVERIEKKLQ